MTELAAVIECLIGTIEGKTALLEEYQDPTRNRQPEEIRLFMTNVLAININELATILADLVNCVEYTDGNRDILTHDDVKRRVLH